MGLTVEQYRLIRKIPRVAMARKLNLNAATYEKYEKNPELFPLGKAKRFCEIVGYSFEEVFLCSGALQNETL